MKNFISFIYNSRDYLTLFLAIFLSLFLISSNDNTSVRAMRSSVLDSYRFIQKPIYTISQLMKVRSENKTIRRKNIELSVMVSNLSEARIENLRLRAGGRWTYQIIQVPGVHELTIERDFAEPS